jgi:hypothetical protein
MKFLRGFFIISKCEVNGEREMRRNRVYERKRKGERYQEDRFKREEQVGKLR